MGKNFTLFLGHDPLAPIFTPEVTIINGQKPINRKRVNDFLQQNGVLPDLSSLILPKELLILGNSRSIQDWQNSL